MWLVVVRTYRHPKLDKSPVVRNNMLYSPLTAVVRAKYFFPQMALQCDVVAAAKAWVIFPLSLALSV